MIPIVIIFGWGSFGKRRCRDVNLQDDGASFFRFLFRDEAISEEGRHLLKKRTTLLLLFAHLFKWKEEEEEMR